MSGTHRHCTAARDFISKIRRETGLEFKTEESVWCYQEENIEEDYKQDMDMVSSHARAMYCPVLTYVALPAIR
eukprot:1923228-Rhodomonas_salina.5